jgi:hypothetical protein
MPGVPHRIHRPRRPSRTERALRRFARGTGSTPVTAPRPSSEPRRTIEAPARIGIAGMWGIAGVVALLVKAIVRLTPLAVEPLTAGGLGVLHVVALVGWTATSIYTEGYKGFQKQFSPRVVARAQYLTAHPRPLHVVLAPAYCMGLFHATRRRLIVSWAITLFVIAAVILVRMMPQPWRGIVDAGVVIALAWGTIALLYFAARGAAGDRMPVEPDVP